MKIIGRIDAISDGNVFSTLQVTDDLGNTDWFESRDPVSKFQNLKAGDEFAISDDNEVIKLGAKPISLKRVFEIMEETKHLKDFP